MGLTHTHTQKHTCVTDIRFIQRCQHQQRHYNPLINGEVRVQAHILLSLRHHGIALTHYRWSPVFLSVCLSIKPDYPWGPAAKSQLLYMCVSGTSHTHWCIGRVSAHMVTPHIKLWWLLLFCDFTHRSAWVSVCVCRCEEGQHTHSPGRSAAVWTLSLFSSQRSVWKAHCLANRGVREAGSPTPLLNLQVQTFSCTMVSREQTLPVFTALFWAVRYEKQLHNSV